MAPSRWFFPIHRWLTERNPCIRAWIQLTLFLIIMAAYGPLIQMFLEPGKLYKNHLLPPKDKSNVISKVTPQVTVAILAAIISGATVTLVTRSVEESLWNSLTVQSKDNDYSLTVSESRNIAQWSVSTFARLKYLFIGKSYTLRLASLCILACNLLPPLLLSGITLSVHVDSFAGNSEYRNEDASNAWTQFADKNIDGLAFKSSFQGLQVPVSYSCTDLWDRHMLSVLELAWNFEPPRPDNCTKKSRMAAFQTVCEARSVNSTDLVDVVVTNPERPIETKKRAEICSSRVPELCVLLDKDSTQETLIPELNIRINFTGSRPWSPNSGGNRPPNQPEGDYAFLFGAYFWDRQPVATEGSEGSYGIGVFPNELYKAPDDPPVQVVECIIKIGRVNITQSGSDYPKIQKETFRTEPGLVEPKILNGLYAKNEWSGKQTGDFNNLWVFSSERPQYMRKSRFDDLDFASSLLTYSDDSNYIYQYNASEVARRIEQAWNEYNILAFTNLPRYSEYVVIWETRTPIYIYNNWVLFSLIIPSLAIISGLVLRGRWFIFSPDVNTGYDPVRIARFGPVKGLEEIKSVEEEYFIADELYIRGCMDQEGRYTFEVSKAEYEALKQSKEEGDLELAQKRTSSSIEQRLKRYLERRAI